MYAFAPYRPRKYFLLFILLAAGAGLFTPATAQAAPCPALPPCGGIAVPSASFADNVSPTVLDPTQVTADYACGAATLCSHSIASRVIARWPSPAARTGDTTGGCVFSASAGAKRCKVDNDGLPVELLQFGVE